MKRIIFLIVCLLFVLHFVFRIYEYKNAYLTPFDASFWKLRYENSQWSTKPACEDPDPHVNPYTCIWDDNWYDKHKNDKDVQFLKKNAIGDDGVYTYAGWAYITGHDPTTLNGEVPPFGKYLIGLSELLLRNENIFSLLSGIFALITMYLVTSQVIKNRFLAFVPVVLFSFEPLFYTQLRAPFLDLLYLSLFFMTMYFFIKKKFIISSLFLGLMAATKSAASTFPLVIVTLLLYLLLTKKFKLFKEYVISLPFAALSFLLTYSQYFLAGHNFIDFLKVQKWIINFYADGAKGSITAPWEMLFTGRYQNWWGQVTVVSEWHIGWSILVLISGFALFIIIRMRLKENISAVAIWVVVYLLFLSLVPVWSRYILLILPCMYTLAIWVIAYKYRTHEK